LRKISGLTNTSPWHQAPPGTNKKAG